jgi:hypothetical protein
MSIVMDMSSYEIEKPAEEKLASRSTKSYSNYAAVALQHASCAASPHKIPIPAALATVNVELWLVEMDNY